MHDFCLCTSHIQEYVNTEMIRHSSTSCCSFKFCIYCFVIPINFILAVTVYTEGKNVFTTKEVILFFKF